MLAGIRLIGFLGMLWTLFVALLAILVSLSMGAIAGTGIIAWSLAMLSLGVGANLGFGISIIFLFISFWRLYHLRRWAGGVISVYCIWMVIRTLETGIWQWTGIWALLSCIVPFMVTVEWRKLRTGF